MFDSLSSKLGSVFQKLSNRGRLTDKDIDEALGTDAMTRKMREWLPDPNPEAYKFLGNDFVEGDKSRVSTSPKESDLEDISRWISEAESGPLAWRRTWAI